jgi:polyphosphate kinase
MQRNFDRRVEIAFPVLDSVLQDRLKEILDTQLTENVKGWWMQSDGRYVRATNNGAAPWRSQERLYELAHSQSTG